MSKRAEQAAKKAIPEKVIPSSNKRGWEDANKRIRNAYIKGYEQAEKDLALTWEDMALAFKCVNAALDDCDGKIREEVLKDALRRFNEQRKKQ